jgi:hypothetical protein
MRFNAECSLRRERNLHEGSIPFTRSIDTEALKKYVARM